MLDPDLGAFARSLFEHDLDIRGSEMIVLLALAKYASSEGVCWPAVGTLANDTGLDPSTVRAAIRRLADQDLVRVGGQREGYKTNSYAIARSLLPR